MPIFTYFVGQIELFSHVPVLRNFVDHLKGRNYNVCGVYLLDSQVHVNLFVFHFVGCFHMFSSLCCVCGGYILHYFLYHTEPIMLRNLFASKMIIKLKFLQEHLLKGIVKLISNLCRFTILILFCYKGRN